MKAGERNLQAEHFRELEERIQRLSSTNEVGKTDMCFLGLLQDRYTISNMSLLSGLFDGFIKIKRNIFSLFKEEGRHVMVDFLYEFYRQVRVKRQHIQVSIAAIEDQINLAVKAKTIPFQHVAKNYKDHQRTVHQLVLHLVKLNMDSSSSSNSLFFDLFLQSYWLGGKVQSDQNVKESIEKLVPAFNKPTVNTTAPSDWNDQYKKFLAVQSFDIQYIEAQETLRRQQGGEIIKKEVPLRYPVRNSTADHSQQQGNEARVFKERSQNIQKHAQHSSSPLIKDKPAQPVSSSQQQLHRNNSQGSSPAAVVQAFSETQPVFFDQGIQDILNSIPDIGDIERSVMMKLYGKFLTASRGEQQEELKTKYPAIFHLSIACSALQRILGVTARSVQIVSCLLFLFKQKTKGRILQINTGEGKSITVALIAATRGLMKEKVDIYTSSRELAKRDSEEFEQFFSSLELTVGSIGSEANRSSEPNEIYERTIVYGDVGSFAADLLGDQYEMRGTRCGRKFACAIVDEVDCMFIDQHNHSTSLAKSIPGLSKLNTVLWLIWHKINQMKESYLNGMYFFFQAGGEKVKIVCSAEKFLLEYTKRILTYGEVAREIDLAIPAHTKAFAMTQLEEWIKNGFYALEMQRNKEYKVDEDKIIPIDFDNTGIAQSNTQWRGGLHQFVQMKENVTVTPMSMTVNFVSNIYMFLLYGSNLIGLTGTLGTKKSVNLLESFYDADSIKIPPFKKRKLTILEPFVLEKEEAFEIAMVEEIQEMKRQGRPCLIICESEKFGRQLKRNIQGKFGKASIVEYFSGGDSIEKKVIAEFIVIISTNLAGRGTDIKLDQAIIDRGGLHVIVAFTPKNKRVEDQAFGRAGRGGQEGSARMLIDGSRDGFIRKHKIPRESLLEERDKVDSQICDRQLQNMKDISKMDEVFWDYCRMLNSSKNLKDKQYLRKQEEEIWATFYCKIQHFKNEPEKVLKEYTAFKEEFKNRVDSSEVANPTYLVAEAMLKLQQERFSDALQLASTVLSNHATHFPAMFIKALSYVMLGKFSKAKASLTTCEELLVQRNDLQQALQVIQLQSQSLVQEEHNEEVFKASMFLDQLTVGLTLTESMIMQERKPQQKYERGQLEKVIKDSGCFKRIKDQEVIRGKLLAMVQEMQEDIVLLEKYNYMRAKLSFSLVTEYFKDDQITEQVLREYQQEEMSYVVQLKETKSLQWKSLTPLGIGVFQLANSLYLLQTELGLSAIGKKGEVPAEKAKRKELLKKVVAQEDCGVSVIGESIRNLSMVEFHQLKACLSRRAVFLIESVRHFQVAGDSSVLNEMSEESASEVQQEMFQKITLKSKLVEAIVKGSPDVTVVAQEMMRCSGFREIAELSLNFQNNCQRLLEKNSLRGFFAKELGALEAIPGKFSRQFGSFKLTQEIAVEIVEIITRAMLGESLKEVTSILEEFVERNYKKELNFNQFVQVLVCILSSHVMKAIDKSSGDFTGPVSNAARENVLGQVKKQIKQLKTALKEGLIQNQKGGGGGYIQQKQAQHYDAKLRALQKFYAFLKEDKERLLLSIPPLVHKFATTNRGTVEKLRGDVKAIISRSSAKLNEFSEFMDYLVDPYVGFISGGERTEAGGSNYNCQEVIAGSFVKKLAENVLTPAFKTVQHVFHNQIESNAIYALFCHIIQ